MNHLKKFEITLTNFTFLNQILYYRQTYESTLEIEQSVRDNSRTTKFFNAFFNQATILYQNTYVKVF